MTNLARNALRFALAAAAGTVCLFINDNMSTAQRSSLITQADARIGEPLTAGSVAGVGRRHARRAVRRSYYGAGYGYGGYYGAYGGYPSAYYGGYANRSYVTGRRTLIPRNYGAYAAYPGGYYGGYGAYAAYPGAYATYPGGYYGAYRGGYYGGYAHRSYVTGRRTLVPRRY